MPGDITKACHQVDSRLLGLLVDVRLLFVEQDPLLHSLQSAGRLLKIGRYVSSFTKSTLLGPAAAEDGDAIP